MYNSKQHYYRPPLSCCCNAEGMPMESSDELKTRRIRTNGPPGNPSCSSPSTLQAPNPRHKCTLLYPNPSIHHELTLAQVKYGEMDCDEERIRGRTILREDGGRGRKGLVSLEGVPDPPKLRQPPYCGEDQEAPIQRRQRKNTSPNYSFLQQFLA